VWLPRFGGAIHTAIVQFSVRALLRSRLHRLILAFYLGMGFAFLVFMFKTAPGQLTDAPVSDTWGQVGTRVIFTIPLDLRANWIFRVTAVRRVPECLAAGRRSLLLLSAAPVWAASAVFLSPGQVAASYRGIVRRVSALDDRPQRHI
jgi:hypothetical protein